MAETQKAAEYIGDVAKELAVIALGAGLATLAHICKMAEMEARERAKEATAHNKHGSQNAVA